MVKDPRSNRTPPAAPLPAGAEGQPAAANGGGARRRSEQRFRAIFDAMFQFIGLMEPDGTLVEANRAALDFGGLRPEDVIGKKFWDCPWWQVSEEAPAQVRAAARRAARGEFVRYETEVLGAGGRVATIDFSIKPVRGDDGGVEFLIPEGRIITEAVQARRMQEGLTAAQVGTFEIDLATQAVLRPASTDGIFGFPPDGAPRDLDAYLDRIHPEDLPAALGAIRRAVEEGGEQFVSFRLLLPDGRVRWATARGVVLPGARGGSPRLIGAIMDVTAQRAAEQERRHDDEQRQAALEAARLGTWDFDTDEGVVRMDARCRAVFGYDRDRVAFEEALARVHPEDRPEVERDIRAASDPATGGRLDVDFRLLRPDGAQRWVRVAGSVLFEGEGKARRAAHHVGVVMDETERKEAERARALLAAIVASSDDAIVSKTLDGVITTWNAGAERLFGYTAEEAVGRSVTMLIPPERRDEEDEILAQIRRGERVAHYETVRLTKDGRRIDVSLTVSPLRDAAGRVVGASKVARNVTAQRQAARALHETEERLRMALSIVPLVLTHVDRDLRYTWFYSASAHLRDLPLLGKRLDELIAPEEAEPLLAMKRRVLATGKAERGEFTYHMQGDLHYYDITAEPLHDKDGAAIGLRSASIDVTDRVRAEDALRESEERFRLAAGAVAGMVYDWEVPTGDVFRTEGLCDLVGVRPEDVPVDRTWWVDRVHPDDRDRVFALIRTVLDSDADHYAVEYRVRHEDGRWVHLWDRGFIVRSGAGEPLRVVGTSTDISDRKRAEAALRASEERQAFLLGLGDRLRSLTDPLAIQAEAARFLGRHLGVARVYYSEVEADGEHVYSVEGYTDGVASVAGRYRLDDFGPAIKESYRAGRTLVIANTADDPHVPEPLRAGWEVLAIRAHVGVPLVKGGRFVAALGVDHDAPRAWAADEVALVEETAEWTWAAVERAKAEAALRESEARFRLAVSNDALTLFEQDADLRYTWVYPQHPEFPEANVGRTDAELVPGEGGEKLMRQKRAVLESGAGVRETVEVPLPGGVRWYDLVIEPRRDAGGRITGVAGVALDVTEQQRAEEALAARARQQATVAELGRLALRHLTDDPEAVQALMDRAVEAAAETLGVPLCKVLELLPDWDHVLLRAGVGWQPGLVGEATEDTGMDSQAGYTLASDAPVVVEDLRTEARFGGPKLLRDHGVVSGMSCVVPGVGGQPWGVLGAHTTARRAFSQDDVHFLQAVANLLGAALQRQKVIGALHESEARFRAMTDSAPMLVWMAGTDKGRHYFNAAWLAFTGRTMAQELDDGWTEGVHPEDYDRCLDTYVTAFEAREPFEMEYRLRRHDGEYRWLLDRGTPRYAPDGALLGYIGSCIDIHDRKQTQARALLLAEAGRLIEQALDYEGALREIARVAVPGFADWCAIDLLHGDGTIGAVAIAHVDPAKVKWGWELREREPIDPEAPTGVPQVIRSGEPEIYPVITAEMLVAAARDEEHLRLLREIGFSSVVTVPMRAGDEVVGAITFVQTESGRHFEAGDIAAAEEIGRRAGSVIETARLHRALQESEERFRAISALTSDFAYAAQPGEDGRFEREWVSGAYERITGYAPDEVGADEPWRRLVHPGDVAEGEAHLAALRSGRPSVSEHRLVTKSGDVRWVRDYARPERDAEGRLVRVIGAVQDITEQKEAEQALRTSEARYRTLFTSIDEGFSLCEMICDEAGRPVDYRFLEVNPVFEDQTGLVDPEGKTALELVPDLEPHWIETYARAGLGGETLRFEEGSPAMGRWFDVFAAPVEPAGSGRFVLVFTDITARKETEAALRESEARFRQLAEALPEIVYTNDAEGRTDYLNAQWFAYTGQPHDVDPGRAVEAVLHPDDAGRIAEGWAAAFEAGQTFEAEFRLRRHDGQYRWFLTRVVPVRGEDDEAISRWFGTSTDIHAQKAAEAELAERVAERTKELERSNRELDQFAYVASHDLKGPLRGIDNLATWIAEDAGDRLPEPSRRHLDLLLGRVQRLEALLDSLLAYSRAGRLTGLVEALDATALVGDVVELLDAPGDVTFEVAEGLPTLTSYRAPLELVFRNLLSNAVKHAARPGLHVRVTAPKDGAPEGFVTFAVADDGPGIPPQYHDRIFGLFQTLRPRDEVEGSGMGLAVVKKTLESLGGTIRVESTPGAGTTFYFTWPRSVGA